MSFDFYAGVTTGLLSVAMALWLFVAILGTSVFASLVMAAVGTFHVLQDDEPLEEEEPPAPPSPPTPAAQ